MYIDFLLIYRKYFLSLGLIPVVLIAAVLAGSGCYVIKKDHAENFADLQKLTNQLKADNSNTLKELVKEISF